MALGRIVIDGSLDLDITWMGIHKGRILFAARGKLTRAYPSGVVPYTIYGDDGALLAVSSVDPRSLLRGLPPPRKDDTIVLDLDMKIECMRTEAS